MSNYDRRLVDQILELRGKLDSSVAGEVREHEYQQLLKRVTVLEDWALRAEDQFAIINDRINSIELNR